MDSSRASIRDGTLTAALGLAVLLPACGQASPIKQSEGKAMTTTTDAGTTGAPGAQQAAEGQSALDKGDFAAANTAFDGAIAAIGDSYVDEKALDDTGMQLTMATAKVKQGDLAGAAKLKAQVVKARLAQAERPR